MSRTRNTDNIQTHAQHRHTHTQIGHPSFVELSPEQRNRVAIVRLLRQLRALVTAVPRVDVRLQSEHVVFCSGCRFVVYEI